MFLFQYLIENLDRDLQYAIRVDGKMDVDAVINYEDVKNAIMEKVSNFSVLALPIVVTLTSSLYFEVTIKLFKVTFFTIAYCYL